MSKGLLDPKVDFVFKNIFGSEKHPEILISFLNATLKSPKLITSVEIKGTDIAKHFIEDKYSRLDVKAFTSNNEIINIEIQLKNEHNMIKEVCKEIPLRNLIYPCSKSSGTWVLWDKDKFIVELESPKMYEEQLGEGEDYSKLDRTVCINILNFKYLKTSKFHTGYRLKEIESNDELTDIIEMHFIEIPKLDDNSDEKDILVAWTEFLKDPESEKVRNFELSVKEIREAKDELIRMSNDSTQREIYEMRAKILKDKVSALNKAKEEGRELGREEGEKNKSIEIAKNLLDVLDDETIAVKTGLTVEEIKALRVNNN